MKLDKKTQQRIRRAKTKRLAEAVRKLETRKRRLLAFA